MNFITLIKTYISFILTVKIDVFNQKKKPRVVFFNIFILIVTRYKVSHKVKTENTIYNNPENNLLLTPYLNVVLIFRIITFFPLIPRQLVNRVEEKTFIIHLFLTLIFMKNYI